MASEASDTPAEPLASRITKDEPPESDLAGAQTDGTPDVRGGSGLQEAEKEVNVKLADLQADPDNPLYSAKSFEELKLSKEIIKGIYALNFRKPSKIQERALPLLLSNPPTNMIAQSQSGTGKTAAFTLNMLTRCDVNSSAPQALVLAPSRELARQILGVVLEMGQFVPGLQARAAIPDPAQRGKQVSGQIIVGTPGTVMDMIRRRLLKTEGIKILVMDEADNMLDLTGLGEQCKRVKMMLPKSTQLILFSATFPDHVVQYAHDFAPGANLLTLEHEQLTVEGIKQLFIDCDSEQAKYNDLVRFYGLLSISSSIIFCKRRDTAMEIEKRMTVEGHQVAHLSAALEGTERDVVIDRFRKGEAKVLITTNVLSRGIDVQSVTMVVNYDVPEMQNGDPDPETYLHRIGRTGRFGRVGVAITFVHNKKSWQNLGKIAEYFSTEIGRLDTGDWDQVEEEIKKIIRSSRAGKTTADMTMEED